MRNHLDAEYAQRLFALSLLLAGLLLALSISGLLYAERIYPSEALRLAFLPNDVANLLIGAPMLLVSLWLARRGRLVGLLLWPGALLYLTYTYLVYAFCAPLGVMRVAYAVVVVGGVTALALLLAKVDRAAIGELLSGLVPTRFTGALLFVLGALILARAGVMLMQAVGQGAALPPTELALHLADLIVAPVWILGGVLCWRRTPLGYTLGMALLFQASMLFVGLVLVLTLEPVLVGGDMAIVDIAVVLAMGLICFVPLWLYIRGATRAEG